MKLACLCRQTGMLIRTKQEMIIMRAQVATWQDGSGKNNQL